MHMCTHTHAHTHTHTHTHTHAHTHTHTHTHTTHTHTHTHTTFLFTPQLSQFSQKLLIRAFVKLPSNWPSRGTSNRAVWSTLNTGMHTGSCTSCVCTVSCMLCICDHVHHIPTHPSIIECMFYAHHHTTSY